MKTAIAIAVLSLACASGCATTALTPEGAKVPVMKADPPQGCKEIGSVNGDYAGFPVDEATSKTVMRNRAAEQGANVPVHRVSELMAIRDHMRMGVDVRIAA